MASSRSSFFFNKGRSPRRFTPRDDVLYIPSLRGSQDPWQSQSSLRGRLPVAICFALCHPECNEGSPTRLPFLTPSLVGFEEILHFVQNDILGIFVHCFVTAVDPHVAPLLGVTFVCPVIARVARPVAISSRHCEGINPWQSALCSVILSVTKDLLRDYPF